MVWIKRSALPWVWGAIGPGEAMLEAEFVENGERRVRHPESDCAVSGVDEGIPRTPTFHREARCTEGAGIVAELGTEEADGFRF